MIPYNLVNKLKQSQVLQVNVLYQVCKLSTPGKSPPDFLGRSSHVLYKLDTAALALLQRRHVLDGQGVVEGVSTPRVMAAVALETVNVVAN